MLPIRGELTFKVRLRFDLSFKFVASRNWEDRFIAGVLSTWKKVQNGLYRLQPSCIEEWYRQPLLWNSMLLVESDHMLGSSPGLGWAALANGQAKSVGE